MATITIAVTVSNPGSGNKYYLDGVLGAYAATPGNTYKFDQSAGSNSGHPLRFATEADGANSSSYTTGVTTAGTPGSSGAYTQIVVTATTPQALFYYCTSHNGMGSSFNTGGTGTVQLQDRDGFRVENRSSDSTSLGQIYYNSTSGQFKGVTAGVGSWSSGTSFSAPYVGRGAAGPTNASIFFGGQSSGTVSANTELYNGTAWTETANLTTAAFMFCPAKQGTQTAALAASGSIATADLAKNELWNGTSWSEVADLSGTHSYADGAGTSTASLAIGRGPSPNAVVESWNGTSWAEVGDLNEGRYFNSAAGTQTAALNFSGDPGGPFTAKTESWNGNSWTEVSDLNTARSTGGGFGLQTSALMVTGYTPTVVANTEQWDGNSWTEVADVATARTRPGSTGASGAAGIIGGGQPSGGTSVEEWSVSDFEVKTLTTS